MTYFNIYYSTSETGPWTLANEDPLSAERHNEYTIEGLSPGVVYYACIVGGELDDDGEFYPLIDQTIRPLSSDVDGIGSRRLPGTVKFRTFSPRAYLDNGSLVHKFTIPFGDITRIQYNSVASGGGVTSLPVTLDDPPAEDNLLILAVGWFSSVTVTGVTQDGVIWTKASSAFAPDNSTGNEIWYARATAGAGATATISFSGFALGMAFFLEYSNAALADVLDKVDDEINDTAGDIASTGTTVATTQATELWFGSITTIAGSPQSFSSPTNGFSILDTEREGSTDMVVLEKTASTVGTAGTTVDLTPGTAVYAGNIATFKKRLI